MPNLTNHKRVVLGDVKLSWTTYENRGRIVDTFHRLRHDGLKVRFDWYHNTITFLEADLVRTVVFNELPFFWEDRDRIPNEYILYNEDVGQVMWDVFMQLVTMFERYEEALEGG